jgi:hypothetical protein
MTDFAPIIKRQWGPFYLEIWPGPYWSAIIMIEALGLQVSAGAARAWRAKTEKG